MKKVMNILIVLMATLSFAACEKANNPVSPAAVDKTTTSNSGTFEVTFDNYKNSSQEATITGDINFNFDTDTYSYNAVGTTDNELSGPLHDSGTYSMSDNGIEMMDNAAKMMSPVWQSSLYLSGNYSYRVTDDQIIIDGKGEFGTVKIILNK